MSEPSLENISDYSTLEGNKKKVVIAVILSGLIIGIIYTIAYNVYDNSEDALVVEEKVKNIPFR